MTRAADQAASLRELAQRRDARVRRRRLLRTRALRAVRVVRPLTWVLAAAAASALVLGLSLQWREAIIAAIVIGAVFVLSVPFLFGPAAYAVALTMPYSRVVAGERAYGELTLSNLTSRTLPASRIVLPVGPGRGAFDAPRMRRGEVWDELFSIPTTRRGVITVGPLSVLRGDPLGLFERVVARGEALTLYVHPRTVAVEGLSVGGVRDLEGLPTREISSDDVSFHALREYQPGDDLRHVHWASTARTGTVMMRQYEQSRRSTYLIGLTTGEGEYAGADEFELAVSIAASLGLRAVTDSSDLVMLVPGRRIPAHASQRLLDELSEVETARGPGAGVEAVAIGMVTHPTGAALGVIVTGSETSAAALRAACARIPADVRTLVLQAAPGRPVALRHVGAAQVITLGDLADLAPVLRRVLS